MLRKDGHYPIKTFSTLHKFGSQKFLPASNLAFKTFWAVPHSELEKKYNSPHIFSRLTWAVPKKYSPLPNFFDPSPQKQWRLQDEGFIVYYLKNCLWILPLTVVAQLSPNQKCYQLSQPEIEVAVVENVCGILHVHMCRKDTISRVRRLKPL